MNIPSLVAPAIDLLGHNSVTIVRETGQYDETTGLWVADAPPAGPPLVATGTITPATGRDLQRLPEGRRNIETIRFITRSELRTAQPGQNADRFDYNGATWEVEHAARWDGSFWDILAVRRGE